MSLCMFVKVGSLSTMWDPEINLRSSDSVGSDWTH